MKPIKIKVHEPADRLVGVVRIAPDAERTVQAPCRESGLSAKYIVSELIRQGADLVEFVPD